MNSGYESSQDSAPGATPGHAPGPAPRKVWLPPAIEDADIGALTNGGGTSGQEGTSFLKPGS